MCGDEQTSRVFPPVVFVAGSGKGGGTLGVDTKKVHLPRASWREGIRLLCTLLVQNRSILNSV